MDRHFIELDTLSKKGRITAEMNDDILNLTVTRSIHDVGYNIVRDKISSFILLPEKYRLPMEIELTLKIDSPELLILIGAGHVSIGSPWMENRRIEDISEPMGKPKIYDNQIPFDDYVDIRLVYNLKEMQISINGEERYFSKRERYMRDKSFPAKNEEGFDIGITCTKRARLSIKSISVTEYEDKVPVNRDEGIISKAGTAIEEPQPEIPSKPTYESCIEGLPAKIKNEINQTDCFLKSLGSLKFKRVIEKHGNKITYIASGAGISYALYLSGNVMHHSLQWYIITNSKPEEWHRKSNSMEETLDFISRTDPSLADRIFYNLNECIGCREHCMAKTAYKYQGQNKLTCHGHVFFKMCEPDFRDVRDFFSALNELLKNNCD